MGAANLQKQKSDDLSKGHGERLYFSQLKLQEQPEQPFFLEQFFKSQHLVFLKGTEVLQLKMLLYLLQTLSYTDES